MLNKSTIKIIVITSIITGAILGLIPLIPALIWIALFAVMFFIAPFIIIYLKKLKILQEITMEQSLLIGGISGASAYIGFTVVYFPVAYILYLIFKIQSFLWIKVIITNFGFLLPMVILIALLCGLLNMFSAFLTVYIYDMVKQKNRG